MRTKVLGHIKTYQSDLDLFPAHRFEQYFTFSQFFSHFLRQLNGRSHTGHIFDGSSDFFII